MDKKIGLALSGGGVRGAAQVGLIQLLEEKGVEPSVIAGTSAGAIVGGLYAAGHSARTMLKVFKETRLFDFSHFTWLKPGLLDAEKLIPELKSYFYPDDFSHLKKELYVVATKILTGEKAVLHSGSVVLSILASAAFPGVFSPIRIAGELYVDGGVIDNFPTETIRDKCDVLIGFNVNPISQVEEDAVDGTLEVLRRAYELSIRHQAANNERFCDFCLSSPKLVEYGLFDQDAVEAVFDIGYQTAKERFGELERLLAG